MAECIKVVVRCRPLNSKEKEASRQQIVDMDMAKGEVALRNPEAPTEAPKTFTFDTVFDSTVSQRVVYDRTAAQIVKFTMEGYNGTIFAYGQTGTGKTHTMEGYAKDLEQRGIMPNAFQHIFDEIEASQGVQYLVRASYLEIYNEEIRDLLSKTPKDKLDLKENKDGVVYVKGLNAFVVKSFDEIQNVLDVGKKNRSVGFTLMNADSSRSHSVFSITIESLEDNGTADGNIRVGKLNLVDLAGSERQSKTGASGDRLKEATKINLSLSSLGNVISALADGKGGHIPYRDSKLTRLLQDSLGGNTKTCMVSNLGPADWNYEETLSTLRYANRAKNIKNKPKINEDPKDAMLREFQEEIKRLKEMLEAAESGQPVPGMEGMVGSGQVVERVRTVPKALDPAALDKMRAEMEVQMRKELAAKQGSVGVTEEQINKLKEEAAEKARVEAERLEAERRKNEEEAAKLEKKKNKMEAETAKVVQDSEKIRAEKEVLAKKLAAMEGKILMGESKGGLAEITRKKEEELQKREAELQKRRQQEADKEKRIKEMEDMALANEEKYSSLAEEAEQKTKKLKKLLKKYNEIDTEVADLYKEFQREKEDLLDSIRMLQDQMQLKDMVIEAFIPPEEMQKVMRRAHWDEEREVWVLERLSDMGKRDAANMKRPVSASGQRRPMSGFAKMANALGDLNPRFKSENILNLELDMPERTTYDYQGPYVDPQVQAAINAAFADDGQLLFVGSKEHMYLGDDVTAMEVNDDGKKRPGSARRVSKTNR